MNCKYCGKEIKHSTSSINNVCLKVGCMNNEIAEREEKEQYKFIRSNTTGKYYKITEGDRDFNTPEAQTEEQLKQHLKDIKEALEGGLNGF